MFFGAVALILAGFGLGILLKPRQQRPSKANAMVQVELGAGGLWDRNQQVQPGPAQLSPAQPSPARPGSVWPIPQARARGRGVGRCQGRTAELGKESE